MSLSLYRKKRDFKKSKEPSGLKHKGKHLSFTIQKHFARRLHYDLRLEMEGVLKSWAVPKGPSMDPKVKRLAIQVEDHPVEYGSFQGMIPKGQYGAGKVEIWDQGTYTSVDSSKADEATLVKGLKKGELKFILHGKKLKGEFVLIKLKNDSNQWLLIKKKDEFSSNDTTSEEEETDSRKAVELSGVKRKMPHHMAPMLASTIDEPFSDPEWIFEIKWDGYRAISEVSPKKVEIYSRNYLSFAERFPPLVKELQQFKEQLIFDGEIVVLNKRGESDFQLLQNYLQLQEGEEGLRYYIFDLLYYQGRDITDLPLIERKTLLKNVLEKFSFKRLLYSDHVEEFGEKFFKQIRKNQLEGVIAKHKQSVYVSKRSQEWLKIKARLREEAVICGFTQPQGGRKKFGALVLGMYKNKKLQFAGHVGGGFDEKSLHSVYQLLQPLITTKCPFAVCPKTNTPATWVKPRLICQVEFHEWTQTGIMRQPIFLGIRVDKEAKEVKKEPSIHKAKPPRKDSFITNAEKVFWKKEKYTKGDLLEYYEAVSSYILPYLKNRPQVLHRFPDGINGKQFYQKEAPQFTPDWMPTASVEHSEKTINYLLIQDLRSLLYVINLGCIELHPFNSQIGKIDYPDYLILDLDPEGLPFKDVVTVAKQVHKVLEEIGLPSYCKTSGKRGLHIAIPLGKKYTFEHCEQFAHLIAMIVHKKLPKLTSLVRDPKKRQRKVYIDYLQNSRTKTVVAPYSVRPVPKAVVSTPLSWDELSSSLDPAHFTIKTILRRLEKVGDLFKGLLKQKINLSSAVKKLEGLI